MCAYKISLRNVLPVAVGSLTLISLIGIAQDAESFGALQSSSSTGETCAFSLQMEKSAFRMRYMQKVAKFQDRNFTEVSAVEEMYTNVKKVSLFSDEIEGSAADGAGVDQLSVDCLGCHDGSRASNVTINLKNDPFKRYGTGAGGNSDHPIGMDYARYVSRGGNDYKPIFGKSKMVLVDGKVGCLTCHDPSNQERGHLVMSDRGGDLCLSCHGK